MSPKYSFLSQFMVFRDQIGTIKKQEAFSIHEFRQEDNYQIKRKKNFR